MYRTRYYCQILIKTEFSNAFRKMLKYPNFIKIRSVEVQLFHADRRTNMTKLTVAFRNFAYAPTTESGLRFT
jgi:hypothetical protein